MLFASLTLLAASLRPALANYCGTHRRRARNSAPQHNLTRLLLLLLLHGRPSPRSGLLRRNQIAVSQSAASGLRLEVCTLHSVSLSVHCVGHSRHHVTRPSSECCPSPRADPTDVIPYTLTAAQCGTHGWAGSLSPPPLGLLNPVCLGLADAGHGGQLYLACLVNPQEFLGNAVPLGPAKVVRRDSKSLGHKDQDDSSRPRDVLVSLGWSVSFPKA